MVFSKVTLSSYSSSQQSIWYFRTYLLLSGMGYLFSAGSASRCSPSPLARERTFLLLSSAAIINIHLKQHEYPGNLAHSLPGMEVEKELNLAQPSWTVLYERLCGL
jgi:hypothetical protein